MAELDLESEVRIKGPLVSLPEFDHTDAGQARCRLVFPKKCTGVGEINKKPYWVQVVLFGELAEQASALAIGQMVITVSRINANRWMAQDGVTVKTSQNYIGYRVGVVVSLTEPIRWLPGPTKKEKKQPQAELPMGVAEQEAVLPTPENEVDKFLQGEGVPF